MSNGKEQTPYRKQTADGKKACHHGNNAQQDHWLIRAALKKLCGSYNKKNESSVITGFYELPGLKVPPCQYI